MARLKRKKTGTKKPHSKVDVEQQDVAAPSDSQAVAAISVKELKRKPATGPKTMPAPSRIRTVGKEPGWIQRSIQFLREVRIELKKVTWPTRKQTIGSTVVVLVLVMLIALYLGLVDMGLTSLVRAVLG